MPLDIAVLLLPRFSLMALASVLEPFRIANRLAGRDLYRWRFVSPEAGPIEASSGLPITAELSVRDPIAAQRVIVCTSFEPMAAAGRDVLALAAPPGRHRCRAVGRRHRRLRAGRGRASSPAAPSPCTGRASPPSPSCTTTSTTRRSLFERSGRVATCAGGTAGIDLSLTAIAAEHGRNLALDVADQLIHQGIRDAAAPQQLAPMRRYGTRNATVLAAIDLLQRSIEQPPSLAQAAAALGVSPRQLQRLFATHLGSSFKRFDRELRLERAKELLEQTGMTVMAVAVATGFGSVEHFSRSYRTRHGTSPRHRA